MLALKQYRSRKRGFSDLLNSAAMVEDGIVLNKDGSLMAAWSYDGPDTESATALERDHLSAQLNAILARLGTGYMLHVDAIRTPAVSYPSPDRSFFPDPITRLIDDERRQHFQSAGIFFESRHVLVLTYNPPDLRASKVASMMYTETGGRRETYADTVLRTFRRTCEEIERALDNVFRVERLGAEEVTDEDGRTVIFDRFLQHLNFCITGDDHPIALPPIPMYLDAMLGTEFVSAITPMVGDKYVLAVAIDGLPSTSHSGILNVLDQLAILYRWSTRFIFLDQIDAEKHLAKERRKWAQKTRSFMNQVFNPQGGVVNQDSVQMVAEVEAAMAEAASNLVAYGYYSSNVILYGRDLQQVEYDAQAVRKELQRIGFSARIETINTTEAYLGSLPGHGVQNIRRPMIHTLNLADMLPINAVWAGRTVNPCPFYPPESPPLMQVATTGSTPMRVNLHSGDVGHTCIFGPTGSGKSTLLGLIAAQFRRYPEAQVFAVDKGRSILPLTLAVGGKHYDIGSADGALAFCPLGSIETDADQAWGAEWVSTLVELQNVTLTPELRNEIQRALNITRQSKAAKTLSDFRTTLQSKELREAIEPYTMEGPFGALLDSETDTLSFEAYQTFEIEELVTMGDRIVVPVLLYLFHRMERRLDGAPSLFIIDEAWVALGHPTFRGKIREWLKVLRRANCAVVLATQSLSDATTCGIVDVIKESCPTKIFLANFAAREEGAVEFYTQFGLNERQIDIIATATPKQHYYLVQPEGRRLFDLALGPVELSFLGVSGKDDLRRVRECAARYGVDWPAHWLKQKGLSRAL